MTATRQETSAPKVKTEFLPHWKLWSAIDENTYDGPPSAIGTGATEQEAIDDLLTKLNADAPVENGKTVTRLVETGPGAVAHVSITNYVQGPVATVTISVPAYTHDNVTDPAQHAQFTLGPKALQAFAKALTDPLRQSELS